MTRSSFLKMALGAAVAPKAVACQFINNSGVSSPMVGIDPAFEAGVIAIYIVPPNAPKGWIALKDCPVEYRLFPKKP
jgi:hypothetical protein